LRKAVKLRDADILKRRDQASVREPQPDDDYLRVWLLHDELLNAYKGGDTSTEELLLASYERSFLAHGSFKNGERRVNNVSLAFSADVTRKAFDEIYTGKISANSGFLARCTLAFANKKRVANWRPMDADRAVRAARQLVERIAQLPKSRSGETMCGYRQKRVPPVAFVKNSFYGWINSRGISPWSWTPTSGAMSWCALWPPAPHALMKSM
jgi:hypothetical protein